MDKNKSKSKSESKPKDKPQPQPKPNKKKQSDQSFNLSNFQTHIKNTLQTSTMQLIDFILGIIALLLSIPLALAISSQMNEFDQAKPNDYEMPLLKDFWITLCAARVLNHLSQQFKKYLSGPLQAICKDKD